jgi:cytochrome c-type biogenesis protein CcmH
VTLSATLFAAIAVGLILTALAFVLPGLRRADTPRRNVALWAVAALLPIAATLIYLALGTPQAVDARSDLSADLAPTTAADYITRLESHLKRQPRDARGWVLLARAHAEAGRYEAAAAAFAQALAVSPQKVARDPGVLCEYADALAMKQGGRLSGAPAQLVARALELDSRHPMALEMAGSADYEAGRFADAAGHWGELLEQLRPGSTRYVQLTAAVERARAQAAISR